MNSDLGASIIRTVVPLIVALITGYLVRKGIDSSPYQDLMVNVISGVVGTSYYSVIRWLEINGKPRFGWLLGLAKAPVYDATAQMDQSSPTDQVATATAEAQGIAPEGDPVTVEPMGDPNAP